MKLQHKLNQLFLAQFSKLVAIHPNRESRHGAQRKGGWVITRWLPRQTNIDNLADEDLQEIVMTYNLTPRKCLGYITPIQALFKELGRDVRLRFA